MLSVGYRLDAGRARRLDLFPVGDIQYGVESFDQHLYRQLLDEIAASEADPSGVTLTIGMGDYSDFFRPTNRGKIASMAGDDRDLLKGLDEVLEPHVRNVYHQIKRVFKPGRCLGLLEGHHYFRFSDGSTTTQRLCRMLGVPYLGLSCFVSLQISGGKRAGQGLHSWKQVIHAQHGEGGAQYIASDLPKLERSTMPFFEADLYLRGHSTKVYTAPFTRLAAMSPVHDVTNSSWKRGCLLPKRAGMKDIKGWMVNTGGFMRGYVEGDAEGTYVEKKRLAPAPLGYAKVELHLKRTAPQKAAGSKERLFDLHYVQQRVTGVLGSAPSC